LGDSAINIPQFGDAQGFASSFRATGAAGTTVALGAVTSSVVGAAGLLGLTANLKLASFTGAGVNFMDLLGKGSNNGNAITGDLTPSGSTYIRLGNGGKPTYWTLSGNNTFSGTFEIQGGDITLAVTNPLSLGSNTGNRENSPVRLDGNLRLLNDTSTNFVKNVYYPGNGGTPQIYVGKAAGGSGSNQTHTLGDLQFINAVDFTVNGDSGYGLTLGNVTALTYLTNNLGSPGVFTLGSLVQMAATDYDTYIQGAGNTVITGTFTGSRPLEKSGAGTLTLNGANNHVGSTKVIGGRVVMGNALALQYSAYNTTGSDGTTIGVDLNGITTPILGGLSGSVDLASAMIGYSGSVTALTLQPQSGSVTYTGIIANGAATTSLTKAGLGTQVLSGANSYTGGTTVNAGTLLWSGANNLPATGTLQVNSGNFSLADGTAQATSTAALGLASGANLTFDWNAGAVDTLTSTAAATTVAGPVGISINPLNSPTGGSLTLISAPSGLNTATYYLANNTNFTATLSQSATAVTIGSYVAVSPETLLFWQGNKVAGTNTALVDNALALSSGTASNWSTAQGTYTATGVVPGSTADVIFSTTDSPAEQNTVLGADMTVKSVTFHDANGVTIGGNNTLTLTSTATAVGNGTGTGSSAITVTATATGTNTINANIRLGNADTVPNNTDPTPRQTWNVASGTTLTVNGVVSASVEGIYDDPLGLNKASTGTLVLAGANTYRGTTTVSAGTLVAAHATALGTATLATRQSSNNTTGQTEVSSGATLDVRANIGTEAISIAGAGVGSAGALITADTFTGTVGGTVTIAGANTRIGGAGTLAINGVVTGGQPITKVGAGVTTFAGANTYTGITTVSGGVLRLNHLTALPGGIATAGGTNNLTINGGGIVGLGNGDFTRALGTGATQVQFNSTGGGGFAAYTADRSVNFGGSGATVTWGSGSFVPNNQPLILGAAGADMTLTMVNPIALGATTRTIQVNNGSASTDAALSGDINGTAATGGLIKTGTGALNLNGATQGYDILDVNDGTANVNGTLGTAPGLAVVTVTDAGNGTKLRFGTVSQTLSSLTIGAGATVIFTSGPASGSLTGDDGGGKAGGFGSSASSFGGGATVPEPGTLGLLLVGALGMLNRRRRQT
jgi:autotransporter-associated beta strand protein